MLQNYIPILIFIAVALVMGGAILVAGRVLGPHRPDSEKTRLMSAASRPSRTRA